MIYEEKKRNQLPTPTHAYLKLCNRNFLLAVLAHPRPHGALPVLVSNHGEEGEVMATLPAQHIAILALCQVDLQMR